LINILRTLTQFITVKTGICRIIALAHLKTMFQIKED